VGIIPPSWRRAHRVAIIDFAQQEITVCIAYFGPSDAGCGTNVRQLHRAQPAKEKAELQRIAGDVAGERMWWFQYRPADRPQISGYDVSVRVVSIPSAQGLQLDRDQMLDTVDGVVFVADARAHRSEENLRAIYDLEASLTRHGTELASLPLLFQVNHTDATNARPGKRVVEDINPFGAPIFEAMARQGKGVIATHEAIVSATLSRLGDNLSGDKANVNLTAMRRAWREKMAASVEAHVQGLPEPGAPIPRTLALGATAEIVMHPAALRESVPVQLVRTELKRDRVRVETVVRRQDGTHRKLSLVLEAGGEEESPLPPPPKRAERSTTTTRPPRHYVNPEGDLPPLYYGLFGIAGGFLAGLMLMYILN